MPIIKQRFSRYTHNLEVTMTKFRDKSEAIRKFIMDNVAAHPNDISKLATQHFGITRQAVNKYLQQLTKEHLLTESGHTRNKIYTAAQISATERTYQVTPTLNTDLVWRNDIRPALGPLADNIIDIWHFGFVKTFNNAIAHTSGSQITIRIANSSTSTEIHISDNGVGIFNKLQETYQFLNKRQVVFELTKGKLTSEPERSKGQDIFFSIYLFDYFSITSEGVIFTHTQAPEDWEIRNDRFIGGTTVVMRLDNHSTRTLKTVFDRFVSSDNQFNKTIIPAKLAQHGNDTLITRAHARNLLARADSFKSLILDFKDIQSIGQAFADEIFRVFVIEHPGIEISFENANANVTSEIERARATA
jgi:hypothetical protein